MTDSPPRAQPLAGLRVLDLSRVLAGPWASQILGDLGADVVKVERPGSGDDTRAWGPPYLQGADGQATRESAYFLCANRNKRSIAIDMASPQGQQQLQQLAAKADIVLENFKTGGLAQYGLDYASLNALNPRLIYCSITGFGQNGPYAARPGYDFLIQAMGGLMSITGVPDGEDGAGPQKVGVALTDILTGLYATIGILAALQERRHSGLGQHIDTALLDVQVAALANQASNYLVGGVPCAIKLDGDGASGAPITMERLNFVEARIKEMIEFNQNVYIPDVLAVGTIYKQVSAFEARKLGAAMVAERSSLLSRFQARSVHSHTASRPLRRALSSR